MEFELQVRRKAEKFIEDLESALRQRVWDEINALKANPRPHGCLKLTDFKPDGWRIRIGNIRVLYRVYDADKVVYIFHVDQRGDAYKDKS